MIRLILLHYYRSKFIRSLHYRGKGKFFYDYYLDFCIFYLSNYFFCIFTYRKKAISYANLCCLGAY